MLREGRDFILFSWNALEHSWHAVDTPGAPGGASSRLCKQLTGWAPGGGSHLSAHCRCRCRRPAPGPRGRRSITRTCRLILKESPSGGCDLPFDVGAAHHPPPKGSQPPRPPHTYLPAASPASPAPEHKVPCLPATCPRGARPSGAIPRLFPALALCHPQPP